MNLTNIQLGSNTAPGSPFTVNRYIDANSFKLVINGTGTNIFELTTGISGATRRFAFASSGQYTMDAYGSGTFTGTETKWLAVTAAGLVIEKDPPSGSTITADNGLTMSTATNVQWGSSSPTGASLLHDSYMYTNTFAATILGINAGTTFSISNQHGSAGQALDVNADNGVGASIGTTNGTYALFLSTNPASTNSVQTQLRTDRLTQGTAADGIGQSFDFGIETATGTTQIANQLISKWTTAAAATRTSQFIITGVNSAVTADLFTLSGSGALQLNKYTTGTFTGTPVNGLATDASGNVIQIANSGGLYTASNGLTMTSNNTKLGGTLIDGTTTINAGTNLFVGTSTFTDGGTNSAFTFNNTLNTASLTVGLKGTGSGTNASSAGVVGSHSGSGSGVQGSAVSGAGVIGISSSGNGIEGRSTSGKGLSAQTNSGLAGYIQASPSSTNTTIDILQLARFSSGTAANGIGGKLTYINEADDGFGYESAGIASTWGDVTLASRSGTLRNYVTSSTQNIERYSIFGTYKALTEASATSFVRVNIPTGEVTGGQMIVTVQANDASDFQARTLRYIWSAVNKGGTITTTLSTPEEVFAESAGGSTLSVTIDTNDAGSGNLDFRANATSSLTQTLLRISYQVWKNYGTGSITPQ